MLKFLIITFIIGYLFFWIIGKVFKVLVRGHSYTGGQNSSYDQHNKKKPTDGNVNIDYVPNGKSKKDKKGFKGGEYVDFEEIK
ncbi:MAG: DUF4834 family protein [Fulvivirga sp.]